MQHGMLDRRVRELHDVRALGALQLEAAGEVRVEDVESARTEAELAGLDVGEHVVAERDGPGERRIRDAGVPVDLEPDEAVVALGDRRHPPSTQHERHYASRATATSSSVTPTMASRSATAIASSAVWTFAIPLATFTQ